MVFIFFSQNYKQRWYPLTPRTRKQNALVFFFLINCIYLFIYLWLRWVLIAARGPPPVAASRSHSSLWCTGPVAPRHVGSSQTRARTHVPCTGRQTPNHCTTREVQTALVFIFFLYCRLWIALEIM